jgi:hypothetical protein
MSQTAQESKALAVVTALSSAATSGGPERALALNIANIATFPGQPEPN